MNEIGAGPARVPVARGTVLPDREYTLDREDLRRYARASGDDNPIHLDDAAARALGLPQVVAHGMLTAALAVGAVADWAGGPDRVLATDLRFGAPVPVPATGGARVLVGGTVRSVDEAAGTATVALSVTCDGAKVLGKAMVTVSLGR